MKTSRVFTLLALILTLAACDASDPEVKNRATQSGFSEQGSEELAKEGVTPEEMESIAQARQAGLDEASLIAMVRSLHKRDLKFDLGFALQLMVQQGMGATSLTQLVEIGAIPRWADDIRALKEAGVSDVTIVEIAKLGFVEKKDLLSGYEYGQLKTNGLSDAGLLTFARQGGTAQQLQKLVLELALGKPEPEALKNVGM